MINLQALFKYEKELKKIKVTFISERTGKYVCGVREGEETEGQLLI